MSSQLHRRQDLSAVVMNFFAESYDKLVRLSRAAALWAGLVVIHCVQIMDVAMNKEDMGNFVFAIVSRKERKRFLEANKETRDFARAVTVPEFPETLEVRVVSRRVLVLHEFTAGRC